MELALARQTYPIAKQSTQCAYLKGLIPDLAVLYRCGISAVYRFFITRLLFNACFLTGAGARGGSSQMNENQTKQHGGNRVIKKNVWNSG